MQNSMVMFTFSVFDWNYPFWVKLIQKIKMVNLSWNLVPKQIWICRIQWHCSFFYCFIPEKPFLGKFGPKNQTCQFKLKFGTYTNSNMQNSMAVFNFSVSDRKHSFTVKLVQKMEIVSLSWNLVPRIIRICRIQWWCSLFPFLTGITPFVWTWSKKSKLSV